MTITNISLILNHKPGILEIEYEANQSAAQSGFDLVAGCDFDAEMCIGYPTMRACIRSYEGIDYATACAWIQMVTRREFAALDAVEAVNVEPSVDTHPTLVESGVPFFAFGFPAEIFDAPCNNLNGFAKLEWAADTFLVTMPSCANGDTISRLAGFSWGYSEYDLDGKRRVEIKPVVITDVSQWTQQLSLLRSRFGKWRYL